MPRVKAIVPSIGSTTQRRRARDGVDPSSSPRIASSGNASPITRRIARSASRSAIVTGEPSCLVSTAVLR
jgi:hypothetical protein